METRSANVAGTYRERQYFRVELEGGPGRVAEKDGTPTERARQKDPSASGPFGAPGKAIVLDGLEPLPAIRESCIIGHGGFFIVTFVLFAATLISALRSRRPSSNSTSAPSKSVSR